MPIRLGQRDATRIPTPNVGQVIMFVDDMGHLCVKDAEGNIIYAVLTTTLPHERSPITAPNYKASAKPEPPPAPPPIPTFWDHLTQDDPKVLDQQRRSGVIARRMATRKIQDLLHRIDRLGQYASDPRHLEQVSDPQTLTVVKSKGILAMRFQRGVVYMLLADLRTKRVWRRESITAFEQGDEGKDSTDLCEEHAIEYLKDYEAKLLVQARAKAREEVIEELVDRKIRRITRAKSRGFKADQKRGKKKRQAAE